MGIIDREFLADGMAALAIIQGTELAVDAARARLRGIVETGDATAMPEVLAAIARAGSIAYSRDRAAAHAAAAEDALAGLPDSPWLDALRGLARYAVSRSH